MLIGSVRTVAGLALAQFLGARGETAPAALPVQEARQPALTGLIAAQLRQAFFVVLDTDRAPAQNVDRRTSRGSLTGLAKASAQINRYSGLLETYSARCYRDAGLMFHQDLHRPWRWQTGYARSAQF